MGERLLPMEMTADEALEQCHRVWDWSSCVAVIRGFAARHLELVRAEASGTRAGPVRVQVDAREPVTEEEAGIARGRRDFSEAMLREEISEERIPESGEAYAVPVPDTLKTLLPKPAMNHTSPTADANATIDPASTPGPVPPASALFKNDLHAVGGRMRAARLACGWDGYGMKRAFATHCGIAPAKYDFAEIGRGVLLHVEAVADGANARAEWLRSGEGEMFREGGARMRGVEVEGGRSTSAGSVPGGKVDPDGDGGARGLAANEKVEPKAEAAAPCLTSNIEHRTSNAEGVEVDLDQTQARMLDWVVASGALGDTREECLDRVITSGLLFEVARVRAAGL